jgi:hypothetical protein
MPREEVSVGTTFVALDVIDAARERGFSMTRRQAEDFILDNQGVIEDRLTELGWEVINDLLDEK